MLALLPLDDRPCNLLFPPQLAAIAGGEMTVPPREALGHFKTPGNAEALQKWLGELPEVEALIIAVDMLAYGGLVASRRSSTSVQDARAHLEILREWRRQRPNTPIYAFNILMRLAITMDSDAAIPHYYNVMRWARLSDEAERFKSEYLCSQLKAVEDQIPPEVLVEYRAARARNHEINLQMVEWLQEGIFDFLLIAQEDCTEYGLHRREQDEILRKVADLGVTDRFALHPGADEGALTLLARHLNTGIRFALHVSNPEDMKRIAAFEDIPFESSLRSHVRAMRGQFAGDGEEADVELFVNAPVGSSQKEEKEEERNARREQIVHFAEAILAAVREGQKVALCDVAFPNGADDLLMRELEKREVLGKLAAFGAWNTAGNTTGTVLAQSAAVIAAERLGGASGESSGLNRRFLFERVLDDWCYQSKVRARLDNLARERGISPLSMNGEAGVVEAAARAELKPLAHMLAARQFDANLERIDVQLPWGRTFEVEVGAQLS